MASRAPLRDWDERMSVISDEINPNSFPGSLIFLPSRSRVEESFLCDFCLIFFVIFKSRLLLSLSNPRFDCQVLIRAAVMSLYSRSSSFQCSEVIYSSLSLSLPPLRGWEDERPWERSCNHPDIWVPQNLFVEGRHPVNQKSCAEKCLV